MTLKDLRVKNGYAQREVAQKLGVKTVNTISNWERGITEPELPNRRQLADLYGVTMEDINEAIDESKKVEEP